MDDFTYFKPKSQTMKYRSMSQDLKKQRTMILVKHGHISITNYKLGDNKDFEKVLSVWKKTHYKYDMIGGNYIKYLKELRIPRGFNVYLLKKFFPTAEFKIYNDVTRYDSMDVELKVAPRSDIQIVAISHMICAPPFEKNHKYTQQLITMDTGEGKSYSTIAAICFHKAKAMITVPTVRIAEQWRDYFLQYTDIPKNKIIIVSGGDICNKIYEEKIDGWIYVFISKTLNDYHTKNGNYKTELMLTRTRAKIKVVDEVHRNTKTMFIIDTLSNFKMNYYLTATDGRADQAEDKVFNRCFKDMAKSDGMKSQQEAHINVIIKKYYLEIPQALRQEIIVPKIGLNSNLYENILFSYGRKELFNGIDFILNWIDTHNPNGNKILFLTSTINGIEELKKHLSKRYPDKSIRQYHSNLSKSEKENFTDGDIIIATDKGAGYGVDIPGTQFMINITTYSNKIGAKQFKGRLRKMNEEVFYFELVNWSFDKTYQQYQSRKPHLKGNAKKGVIIELD